MSDDPPITVITPQFDRQDGKDVSPPPASAEDFEALRDLDADQLLDLGMRKWDEGLHLFPAEWYDHIPTGFEVETINGETERFDPAQQTDDRRFGVLAYGIEVDG